MLSLLCFCSDCLAAYGCDGYPGMMFTNDTFEVTSGDTSVHSRIAESGRRVERHFCSNCGTTVWGQTALGLVSIAAGTLDNPELFNPTKAVFTSQAPGWARIPSHLEIED